MAMDPSFYKTLWAFYTVFFIHKVKILRQTAYKCNNTPLLNKACDLRHKLMSVAQPEWVMDQSLTLRFRDMNKPLIPHKSNSNSPACLRKHH